jgi:hypothetical protein
MRTTPEPHPHGTNCFYRSWNMYRTATERPHGIHCVFVTADLTVTRCSGPRTRSIWHPFVAPCTKYIE